ncbi:GNAT family N-acetyltransferase [Legionella lytica]|uniref:GNAT family N-acetyltransferase n=1 Tax=Legionella lytica TaxID=96232 RepID=A0ABY4Y744_9GAMM|nr:GNAT family N-acetyltransferase [Legionella lytica]USQ13321.1 GNAT family N-acetyltransferase [Legionella lytica]
MIHIRAANFDDIQNLNELITLSARELSRDIYSKQEIEGAIQYIFGVDTELLHDKTYFVIEKNGEIAGCGGWSRRKTLFGGNQFSAREEPAYLDPTMDAAKIRAFFIHPKFARQGLGSMLLQHCEQDAGLHGFTHFEMMATLAGVKLYAAFAYKAVSNERVVLPNSISLKFVRMEKKFI